jgi:predicted enzyme related to lactoylglutathione lyase
MSQLDVRRVGQIALLTRDAGRATEFYGTTVGLPHLYTFGPVVFFDCGGTRLFIREVAAEEWRPGSIVYLLVDDISASYELLTGRGVAFEGAPHHIHTHEDTGVEEWMAFFDDPDGNTLALMAQVGPSPS